MRVPRRLTIDANSEYVGPPPPKRRKWITGWHILTLAVACAVLAMQIQTIVIWRVSAQRRVVCTENGGTYFGARTSSQCIKDGRIIIVWSLAGGRNDNP